MADNWVKISINFFDDEKIRLIESMPEVGNSILLTWIRLIIQARKTNDNGLIFLAQKIPYTPQMLASLWGKSEILITRALKVLNDFGMIDIYENGVIAITNWEKHQSDDRLERIQINNRKRQKRFKEKQKLKALGQGNVTNNVSGNGEITHGNEEITQQNKSIEEEIEIEEKISIYNYDEVLKIFIEIKNDALNSFSFIEQLQRVSKLSEEEVKTSIEQYFDELLACEDIRRNKKDYRTHILNIFKKKYSQSTEKKITAFELEKLYPNE